MGTHKRPRRRKGMSLGTKYIIATALSVLLPLLVYLIFDAFLVRDILVRDQAESLRLAADLVHGFLRACHKDCPRRSQGFLEQFARFHPDLEVLILDSDSKVYAAAQRDLTGNVWHEEGITRLLQGETAYVWDINTHHGELVLDVTVPWLDDSGEIKGAIHLARSLSLVRSRVTAIQIRHVIFVVSVALAVGVVLGLITYRLVVKRLRRVDYELHTTDWAKRAPEVEGGGDEIDHLSSALRSLVGNLANTAAQLEGALDDKNRLLTRVERFNEDLEQEVQKTRSELLVVQQELVRAEHLATIGQLSAGLAHELRNPLFIIRASAESMRRKHTDSADLAEDIIEEVDRVNDILSRLLDLGRPLSAEKRHVDLASMLDDVVSLARKTLTPERSVKLEPGRPEAACTVEGDHSFLRQAFTNLIANACEAVEGPGEVSVTAAHTGASEVEVEIRDTGIGIRDEDLPHIFEPFFTRKPSGTGLGLCATKKILDIHGATISVTSRVGRGTRVVVKFPKTEETT